MQQITFQTISNWEFIILINLLEKELSHTKPHSDKANALAELRTKLQSISLGPKPFDIKVQI